MRILMATLSFLLLQMLACAQGNNGGARGTQDGEIAQHSAEPFPFPVSEKPNGKLFGSGGITPRDDESWDYIDLFSAEEVKALVSMIQDGRLGSSQPDWQSKVMFVLLAGYGACEEKRESFFLRAIELVLTSKCAEGPGGELTPEAINAYRAVGMPTTLVGKDESDLKAIKAAWEAAVGG